MSVGNTSLFYFSPTATTRIILEEIAKGIGQNGSVKIVASAKNLRSF